LLSFASLFDHPVNFSEKVLEQTLRGLEQVWLSPIAGGVLLQDAAIQPKEGLETNIAVNSQFRQYIIR